MECEVFSVRAPMWRVVFAVTLVALGACGSPATSGPEAVVSEIYAQTARTIGRSNTGPDAIPMSEDLRSLVDSAQESARARNEPFIEEDLTTICQDCTRLSDLQITRRVSSVPEFAAEGRALVEARFKLDGTVDRMVLYELIETEAGWLIENITSPGFDLRAEATAQAAAGGVPSMTP